MLLVFEGADAKNPVTDLLLLRPVRRLRGPTQDAQEGAQVTGLASVWPAPVTWGSYTRILFAGAEAIAGIQGIAPAASLGASQHIRLHTRREATAARPNSPGLLLPEDIHAVWGEVPSWEPTRSREKGWPSPHTLPGPRLSLAHPEQVSRDLGQEGEQKPLCSPHSPGSVSEALGWGAPFPMAWQGTDAEDGQ